MLFSATATRVNKEYGITKMGIIHRGGYGSDHQRVQWEWQLTRIWKIKKLVLKQETVDLVGTQLLNAVKGSVPGGKGGAGIEFFPEQKGVQFKQSFHFKSVLTRKKTKKANKV